VHFHEVGAVDAIADVVGACAGLAALDIERVVSYPVAVGAGWVTASHGMMPVPAPATANLLAAKQIPIRPNPSGAETPVNSLPRPGAAILGTLAEWQVPTFTPIRGGYGFGTKQLPWPNALRAWLGEVDDEVDAGGELLLETNIDDMNPQFFELLTERLFAAGALDVWLSNATMKKGRPATIVSVIAPGSTTGRHRAHTHSREHHHRYPRHVHIPHPRATCLPHYCDPMGRRAVEAARLGWPGDLRRARV
jgi:uncharacterized protein (DUF111 family)